MGVAARPRAGNGRSRVLFVKSGGNPAAGPVAAEFTGGGTSDCPELDCVRALLPGDVIEDAAHRAAALGVGADRVLIAAGTLSEEAYLRALAAVLGVAFEPLDGAARAQCPLDDERLIESAAAGILPLAIGRRSFSWWSPRAALLRGGSYTLIKKNPGLARALSLHQRRTS